MAPLMHRRWQRNFRRASEIAGAEVRRGHQLSVTSVALCDTNVLGHSTLSRRFSRTETVVPSDLAYHHRAFSCDP